MIVSGEEQKDLVRQDTCIYLPQTPLPSSLPHNTEQISCAIQKVLVGYSFLICNVVCPSQICMIYLSIIYLSYLHLPSQGCKGLEQQSILSTYLRMEGRNEDMKMLDDGRSD